MFQNNVFYNNFDAFVNHEIHFANFDYLPVANNIKLNKKQRMIEWEERKKSTIRELIDREKNERCRIITNHTKSFMSFYEGIKYIKHIALLIHDEKKERKLIIYESARNIQSFKAFLNGIDNDFECPVCLEEYELNKQSNKKKIILLPCYHSLCFLCYNQVGINNYDLINCPICRALITRIY
jgi:hypothetical protein